MHTSFSVLVDVSTNRIIVNPKGAIYRQSRRSFPAGNQSMHHTFKAVTHDLPTIHHCVIIYGGIFSLAESESGNRSLVLDAEPKKVQLFFFTFSLIKRMARIFFFFAFWTPRKWISGSWKHDSGLFVVLWQILTFIFFMIYCKTLENQ